ncbi:3'-5' exonuclease [Amnibacterium kyonggiense]
MPQIVLANLKQQLEKPVKAKAYAFLEKLAHNDAQPGLHIEPMAQAADSRARTGRVDGSLRAVLFRLETDGGERTYVYAGTFPHDEAILRARTQILRVNPINGVPELIQGSMPSAGARPVPARPSAPLAAAPASQPPCLAAHGVSLADLEERLGFDAPTAERLLAAQDEDALLALADAMPNAWQTEAVLGLAVGDSVQEIREALDFVDLDNPSAQEAPHSGGSGEDERIARSLKLPAARMQFAFIEDDAELRRMIEGADFGAWRVFLHPQQRALANARTSGASRVSGGAGTGKTVVLLHRARELAHRYPTSRIVLTTFTRSLAAALDRDLERLDPAVARASQADAPGVLVRGIDALAVAVRDLAGPTPFAEAATAVLGAGADPRTELVGNDRGWREAIDDAPPGILPEALLSPAFFEAEYLQVVLPNRVRTEQEYLTVRRSGRGVALDRRKRAAMWAVVDRYRANARAHGRMSYAEVSAVAAAWLDSRPARVADHVLVDEAQDLNPPHWQLLRALVSEGPDDLFLAEDTHQRIYGQQVVLSRLGIRIIGRSRRLTLNYRTTRQNLDYALAVLAGEQYVDSEGAPESVQGYRSARTGPSPRLVAAGTATEQLDRVAAVLREWLDDPTVVPSTIAVLTRSNREAAQLVEQLAARGVTVTGGGSPSTPGSPVVLTMHRGKGLEFSRVLLFDVSSDSVPSSWAVASASEDDRVDALRRERSLLYVAASRARDELVITWKGEPSPFAAVPANAAVPTPA